MVSPSCIATSRNEASTPSVTMARCGVPHRACTLPNAAGSNWSTPTTNGRRDTEVPKPPNWPTALAITSSAIERRQPGQPQRARGALAGFGQAIHLADLFGAQNHQQGHRRRGVEHRGECRGDPPGARQRARRVVDLAAMVLSMYAQDRAAWIGRTL